MIPFFDMEQICHGMNILALQLIKEKTALAVDRIINWE
jgi:hypothetical protein